MLGRFALPVLLGIFLLSVTDLVAQSFRYHKRSKEYVYEPPKGAPTGSYRFDRVNRHRRSNLWVVEEEGKTGLFYASDTVDLQWYEQVVMLDERYARIKTEGGYGVLDFTTQELKLKPICQSVDVFTDTSFVIELDGKWIESLKGEVVQLSGPPGVYHHPQVMPVLEGCAGQPTNCSERKLLEQIYSAIRYPAAARSARKQGIVVHEFVLTAEGEIEALRLLQSVSPSLDREARRVIEEHIGTWIPGLQYGEPVATRMVIPIRYRLE